jgi:hypothetical protein
MECHVISPLPRITTGFGAQFTAPLAPTSDSYKYKWMASLPEPIEPPSPVSLTASVSKKSSNHSESSSATYQLTHAELADIVYFATSGEYSFDRSIVTGGNGHLISATKSPSSLEVNAPNEVVIKIIEVWETVNSEMMIMKKLQHPGIIKFLEYRRIDNYDVIIMEKFGVDLDELISNYGTLTERNPH